MGGFIAGLLEKHSEYQMREEKQRLMAEQDLWEDQLKVARQRMLNPGEGPEAEDEKRRGKAMYEALLQNPGKVKRAYEHITKTTGETDFAAKKVPGRGVKVPDVAPQFGTQVAIPGVGPVPVPTGTQPHMRELPAPTWIPDANYGWQISPESKAQSDLILGEIQDRQQFVGGIEQERVTQRMRRDFSRQEMEEKIERLRGMYARGEITKEQFNEAMAEIQGGVNISPARSTSSVMRGLVRVPMEDRDFGGKRTAVMYPPDGRFMLTEAGERYEDQIRNDPMGRVTRYPDSRLAQMPGLLTERGLKVGQWYYQDGTPAPPPDGITTEHISSTVRERGPEAAPQGLGSGQTQAGTAPVGKKKSVGTGTPAVKPPSEKQGVAAATRWSGAPGTETDILNYNPQVPAEQLYQLTMDPGLSLEDQYAAQIAMGLLAGQPAPGGTKPFLLKKARDLIKQHGGIEMTPKVKQSLEDLGATINLIDALAQPAKALVQRGLGNVTSPIEAYMDVERLKSLRNSAASYIAKGVWKEAGMLTNQDIERAKGLLPSPLKTSVGGSVFGRTELIKLFTLQLFVQENARRQLRGMMAGASVNKSWTEEDWNRVKAEAARIVDGGNTVAQPQAIPNPKVKKLEDSILKQIQQ